jgi:hypothetical protein
MKKTEQTSLEHVVEERDRKFELKKKNYTGPHCCWEMHCAVTKHPDNISPNTYNPKLRGYYLSATKGHGGEQISFCPRCGKKLPKELSNEWFDIIRNDYGLDPWMQDEYEKIPAEFLTDEWWKKRGL